MKPLNIGLIWANPYSSNLGVSALSYSTLYLLENISKAKNIKFTYTILASSGPKNDTLNLLDYTIEIKNSPWDYNGSLKSFTKLAILGWDKIYTLSMFDLIFDIGYGDSFADIYGIKRFRKINGSKWILRLLRKKTVLLPQTIGPFSSKEAKKDGTTSIKKMHLVLTRDKQSYDYVQKLLPGKKVYELIDVAFFMPYKKCLKETLKTKIGVNISGLLWNGGYTGDNQFHLKTDYRSLTQKTLNYFLSDEKNEVYLIGHVLGKNQEIPDDDWKALIQLKELYPKAIVAPIFTNPIEAKSFISGMDFFTGARMHACIAAYSTEVPVYPLAYSRKFNGLFGNTLSYNHYGDLVNLETDTVFNDMHAAFQKRLQLKNEIKNTLATYVCQKKSELINLMSNVIKDLRPKQLVEQVVQHKQGTLNITQPTIN
ncbi:MAG: polysaccharide pyruvyl transferase family protein [Ferruginibacter sp.]